MEKEILKSKVVRAKNKGKIGRLLPMDETEEAGSGEACESAESDDADGESWLSRLFEETWGAEAKKSPS